MYQHWIKLLVVLGALLSLPQAALALSCKDAQTQSVRRVISLTEDIYVSTGDLTPGQLLWRSENYTVTFRCVDDYNNPGGESSYLYWDPAQMMNQIDPSIAVGITYKSVNYQLVKGERQLAGAGTSPPANKANCTRYWNRSSASQCATSQQVTVTFSVYIVATGAPPPASGQVNSQGTYDLFQVDGVGGLNDRPGANYRAAISGLGRIHFISCNPDIRVRANAGNAIDFGRIASNRARAGTIERSVPFVVEINMTGPNSGNQCNNRALVGSFSTSHPVQDGTVILPRSDSGFGIVLVDAARPTSEIAMNTAVPLGVINSTVVQHDFIASLKWLSDTPRIGPFRATATIDVSFR
ncbi:fimbrial protein [Bordetella petrii]|uniref:fimbrial protein n=1 Tax=Bordetella petrii TaxID=94624 RepID=UPI001A977C30|nr:fimbrial protein [Bordetella petrii]MBO1114631.1 fimbrial protein [Bordetella petrii]